MISRFENVLSRYVKPKTDKSSQARQEGNDENSVCEAQIMGY